MSGIVACDDPEMSGIVACDDPIANHCYFSKHLKRSYCWVYCSPQGRLNLISFEI
jgi:hypothetical protein